MTKVFYHVIVNIKNIDEEYVNHFWNGLAFYNKGLKIGILNLDWDKLNKNVCFNSICSCKFGVIREGKESSNYTLLLFWKIFKCFELFNQRFMALWLTSERPKITAQKI